LLCKGRLYEYKAHLDVQVLLLYLLLLKHFIHNNAEPDREDKGRKRAKKKRWKRDRDKIRIDGVDGHIGTKCSESRSFRLMDKKAHVPLTAILVVYLIGPGLRGNLFG